MNLNEEIKMSLLWQKVKVRTVTAKTSLYMTSKQFIKKLSVHFALPSNSSAGTHLTYPFTCQIFQGEGPTCLSNEYLNAQTHH